MKWLMGILMPVLAWALLQVFASKVDVTVFDRHVLDSTVALNAQRAAIDSTRAEMREILCAVKPRSSRCP